MEFSFLLTISNLKTKKKLKMLLSNLLLLINFYIRLQFTESTHGLWCTWPAIYRAHAVYILRCLFSEFKHGCGNQLPMLPWRAYFHPSRLTIQSAGKAAREAGQAHPESVSCPPRGHSCSLFSVIILWTWYRNQLQYKCDTCK
jgi:hypothetical protein